MKFHVFFCICGSSINMHFLPYLHYIQIFVGDSQCTACYSWKSIRRRAYSRVQVVCIDNMMYLVVFFLLQFLFHVWGIKFWLISIISQWTGCSSHRRFFSLGIYCFFLNVLDLGLIGVISGILLDVDIDEASGSMEFIVFWVARTFVGFMSEWTEAVLEVFVS